MRRLRRLLALALLLLGGLGVTVAAQQLLLAARPVHGLDSDRWQMTTAYWLAANDTLTFSLEPGAQALRLLSNAISDQPLDAVSYSLQLDILDQAARRLKLLTVTHRAADSRRQRRLSSLATNANRDAFTTEQSLLSLGELPDAAEVRITLRGDAIAGIGLRSYWRQQRRENRLTSAWQRLHQDKRERLAAANVLPVGYLKPEESRNLMRYRWRPLAPQGVAARDYQIATLFEPLQPEPAVRADTLAATAPSTTATTLRIGAYAMTASPLHIPLHRRRQPTPLRLDLRLPLPTDTSRKVQALTTPLTVRAWAGQRLIAEWHDQLSVTAADDEWLVSNPQQGLSTRAQRYINLPPQTDLLEIEAAQGSLLALYNRPAQAPFLDLREEDRTATKQPIHNWQSLDRRLQQGLQPQRRLIARPAAQATESAPVDEAAEGLTAPGAEDPVPTVTGALHPARPEPAISVLLPLSTSSKRPAEQRYRRLPAGRHRVQIATDPAAGEPRLLITGRTGTDALSISSEHQTLLQLAAGSGIGRAQIAGLTPGPWNLLIKPSAGQQLFLSHGGGAATHSAAPDSATELFGERLIYPLRQQFDFSLPPGCCAAGSISVRLFGTEGASKGRTIVLSELRGARRGNRLSSTYSALRKRSELTLQTNPVVAMLNPGQPALTHQALITLVIGEDLAVQPQQLRLTVEQAAAPLYVSALLHRPETDANPLRLKVAQR